MNPVGIGIGWALSGQNDLVTGIFTSISAGILFSVDFRHFPIYCYC